MSTEKMVRSELNRLMKVRIRVIGAPSPATAAERKEWDLEKDGWAMVEFHRVETERNRVSDLTGSRVRISDSRSWGMDTGRVLSCSSSIVDRHTKQVLAQGRCENGLYLLQPDHQAFVVENKCPKASFEVWHTRLVLSIKAIVVLIPSLLVFTLPVMQNLMKHVFHLLPIIPISQLELSSFLDPIDLLPSTPQPTLYPTPCTICTDPLPPPTIQNPLLDQTPLHDASPQSPTPSLPSSQTFSTQPTPQPTLLDSQPSLPPPSQLTTTPSSPVPTPPPPSQPTTPPSSPIPPPSPPPIPTHPMITRAKSGIFKPQHRADLSINTPLHHALVAHTDPKTVKTAIKDPIWVNAMQQELHALSLNNTWTLVPRPTNRPIVGSKWVFRTKLHSDGSIERQKARLVAQGFSQTPGLDYSHTFSPVVKATTIRIILCLAMLNRWTLHQLDVNSAFLHGNLQETVYMEQPLVSLILSFLIISFIKRLNQEFTIKDLGELNYFLGLEVSYTKDGLFSEPIQVCKRNLRKGQYDYC
ncbi:hypothetical protein E3N88_07453 [Mikania micrantha]|uniref:Reverse transcriptase Ty1/copia-type domain-containing protein n=1 Tax=Mikania micrantha TaxID=192012 RepID=A0A5N6PTP7_9ASTR|nr:hypothetical protein E3N88_07453 [Mikania micrantha]